MASNYYFFIIFLIITGQEGDYWDEIEFFDREEFRCQCGGKYCNGFPTEPHEATVRFADAIVVLNRATQDYFMDTYGRETVFIPNGVNRPEQAALHDQ